MFGILKIDKKYKNIFLSECKPPKQLATFKVNDVDSTVYVLRNLFILRHFMVQTIQMTSSNQPRKLTKPYNKVYTCKLLITRIRITGEQV